MNNPNPGQNRMKPIKLLTMMAALSATLATQAADVPAQAQRTDAPPARAKTDAVVAPESSTQTNGAPATAPDTGTKAALGPDMLMLNFRGASLEQVLSYLSEAAGYIINIRPGTSVRGKVDVWSSEPVTRDDALNLLDTVLNQNGLAAIRNGRMLSIVNRDEAKTQNIPVIQGADPKTIPLTDKIVTQIIPVRFVEASQLLKDLQPLVSMNVTMTANEAGNAIVITDTQANIHKVAEIVHN